MFIEQYKSHYCYGCEEYKSDVGIKNPCPKCGEELEYLHEYRRLYCHQCKAYAPRDYGLTREGDRAMTKEEGSKEEGIGYTVFSREDMDLASKEELMSWCREYGLDDTGMKYELRLRLLEHIRKQGLLLKGEKPIQVVREELSEPEVETAAPEEDVIEELVVEGDEKAAPQVEVVEEAASRVDVPENACANCGTELTYIPQYGRWYCYSCQTYAGSEPASETQAQPSRVRADRAPTATKVVRQKGGNPKVGISLAAVGLLMFIADMLLFRAPAVFDFPVLIRAPDLDFALQFLSIVFIALGLMAAIIVRPRH